jgi:hypothetical protein
MKPSSPAFLRKKESRNHILEASVKQNHGLEKKGSGVGFLLFNTAKWLHFLQYHDF